MAYFKGIVNWLIHDLEDDKRHPGITVELKDGAGFTRYGITSRDWGSTVPPEFFTTMSNEDAYTWASRIYYNAYFLGIKGDSIILDPVAAAIFQFAVVRGVKRAVQTLQRVLQGITPDGVFGAQTLNAVNITGYALLGAYQAAQERFYRTLALDVPSDARFLDGWLKRAHRVYPN